MSDEFLTTKQAAELMNRPEKFVRELCRNDDLEGLRRTQGESGHWRIPKTSVEDWIAIQRNSTPSKPRKMRGQLLAVLSTIAAIIAILGFLRVPTICQIISFPLICPEPVVDITPTPTPTRTPELYIEHVQNEIYFIKGSEYTRYNVGDDLVVYSTISSTNGTVEVPSIVLRIVAENPNSRSAQPILVHPELSFQPNSRVDNQVNQLSTSDLILAIPESSGYLLAQGRIRLRPDSGVQEGDTLEALEPQIIDGKIVDYLSFDEPIHLKVKDAGQTGNIAKVELIGENWPPERTLVFRSSTPFTANPSINTVDCTAATEVSSVECEALVALYNNTDGPNWITHTNWLETGSSPCKWEGVECYESNPNIKKLNLASYGLKGVIPPEIRDLTMLTELNLSDNELIQCLPVELENLAWMNTLNLRDTHCEGEIPSWLGNLSNLTQLHLHENNLIGPIPAVLGNLSHLKVLNLGENELSGGIPSSVGDLENLTALGLGKNTLTGTIPSELGNLIKLKSLNLFENELSGPIPPELARLSELEKLNLADNRLTGSIPVELGELSKLNYLSLTRNQITGTIPATLGGLLMLAELWLDDNMLHGPIPSGLGGQEKENLWRINLSNNRELDGPLPISLMDLPLKQLYYAETEICDPTDNEFQAWFLGLEVWSHSDKYCDEAPENILLLPEICTSGIEMPIVECEALVTLYNSTGGPKWITSTNWLEPDTSPCTCMG